MPRPKHAQQAGKLFLQEPAHSLAQCTLSMMHQGIILHAAGGVPLQLSGALRIGWQTVHVQPQSLHGRISSSAWSKLLPDCDNRRCECSATAVDRQGFRRATPLKVVSKLAAAVVSWGRRRSGGGG